MWHLEQPESRALELRSSPSFHDNMRTYLRALLAGCGCFSALIADGCSNRPVKLEWKNGEESRGDWNYVLHSAFKWETKFAEYRSRELKAACALTISPTSEVVRSVIKELGLVEQSKTQAASLEGVFLSLNGSRPSIWRGCWEGYPNGLGFPSSCGHAQRSHFAKVDTQLERGYNLSVCYRSQDAVVVVFRDLYFRPGN